MGPLMGSLPVCPRNQHCAQWARIYMKFCLCSVKDGLSLTLGLVSVISWGVAEVPQIITNYRQKSTEGVSITFLMTWIVGDLFNLLGCKLEPATLPTQYYMAMLYTATTVILASQTIYYGHIYYRLEANKIGLSDKGSKVKVETVIENKQTCDIIDKQFKDQVNQTNGSSVAVEGLHLTSSPIPVTSRVFPHSGSHGEDFYFMSARYLLKSRTPTAGSYLSRSREAGGSLPNFITNQNLIEEPLLGQSAPPSNTKGTLCVVSAMTFFLTGYNLHLSMTNRSNVVLRKPRQGLVIHVARRLLQSNGGSSFRQETDGSSGMGTFLGWVMAAIYMGGRFPQIYLNNKRGNVEGLSPLMFIFALVGNITYVASILVSSLDWSRIIPNLPWLVDAGGCVLLDCFILVQFIYFRCWKHKDSTGSHGHVVAD